MRSNLFRLALFAAALAGAPDADAKARRVVVLGFDGPLSLGELADKSRANVMSLLAEQYDVIATKKWDTAFARAPGRGPQQWRQASKQAGVDAVVEGWVQAQGKHHILTIAVRDAASGNEIDTISIRIKSGALTNDVREKLASQLDELLGWIDSDVTAEPTSTLPDVRTQRPMLGARDNDRDRPRPEEGDDDERPRSRRDDRRRRGDDERGDDRRDDRRSDDRRNEDRRSEDRRSDDGQDRDVRDDDEARRDDVQRADADTPSSPEPERAPMPMTAVAQVSDPDTSDLVKLFGPEADEVKIVEPKINHVPTPTPRFQISAGAYVSSRGMEFEYDSGSQDPAPTYPAQSLKGIATHFAVYPMPLQKQDGDLSGVGFTLDLAHSIASVLPAMDETGYGDYTLTHTAWETGVHYRYPIDMFAFDGAVKFGNVTHALPSDFPESVPIPDTSYSYLAASAHVDLTVTERAKIGVGATYMYLLSAGMVTEQDWYGAGKAGGFTLDGNVVIPLPRRLYINGGIEYRRIKIDFEGSGELAMQFGVWNVVDSAVSANANLGIGF